MRLAKKCLIFMGFSLLCIVLFISCISDSGKQPYTEEFAYPLATGNSWAYERIGRASNFRDTSGNPLSSQPTDSILYEDSVRVEVDRIDTLPGDTAPCFVLLSNAASENWYRSCTDGLFEFAYLNNFSAPWATPKRTDTRDQHLVRFRFKGRTFASLHEMTDCLLTGVVVGEAKAKTGAALLELPTVRVPPIQALMYPYTEGTLWSFGSEFRIGRQYTGIESVEVPAGRFECYKVNLLWDFDKNSAWDTDVVGYEYISRTGQGLIKRDLYYYRIQTYDEIGRFVGIFDEFESCRLTSYSLK